MAALSGTLVSRFALPVGYAAGTAIVDLVLNAVAALAIATALQRGLPMGVVAFVGAIVAALSWTVYFQAESVWLAACASAAFLTAMGALHAVIWGLLPTVTPEPRMSGAASGLVTQATYIGMLLGPPLVFTCLHDNALFLSLIVGTGFAMLLLLAQPPQPAGRAGLVARRL